MIEVTFKYVRFIGEELIGSLIGSGVSLLGNFLGAKESENSSMRMARYMNEYNKPANQIKRLKEAGLNPALALNASLNDVSGNQSSMAPPADYTGIGNSVGTGLQAGLLAAQTELMKAQAKQANANADKTAKDTSWVDILNGKSFELLDSQSRELLSKIPVNEQTQKNLEAEFSNISKIGENLSAQTDLVRSQMHLLDDQDVEQKIRNKYADALQKRGVKQADANINATYASAKSFISQAALNNSQSRMTDLQWQIEDFLRRNGTIYRLRDAQANAAKSGAVLTSNEAKISSAAVQLQTQMANFVVMLDVMAKAMGIASPVIGAGAQIGSAAIGSK